MCYLCKSLQGFELSILQLQNAIYFSVIAMSEKSRFTIFTIKSFMQNATMHT